MCTQILRYFVGGEIDQALNSEPDMVITARVNYLFDLIVE